MKKLLILAILTSVILCSCSEDEVIPVKSEDFILTAITENQPSQFKTFIGVRQISFTGVSNIDSTSAYESYLTVSSFKDGNPSTFVSTYIPSEINQSFNLTVPLNDSLMINLMLLRINSNPDTAIVGVKNIIVN